MMWISLAGRISSPWCGSCYLGGYPHHGGSHYLGRYPHHDVDLASWEDILIMMWVSLAGRISSLLWVLLIAGELEELIKHGLRALRDTLPSDVELTTKVSTDKLLH